MDTRELILEIMRVKTKLINASPSEILDLTCALIELQSSLINQLMDCRNKHFIKELTKDTNKLKELKDEENKKIA